ncbi:MAG: leucine--tRNA ligase [Methanosarcinales archaeon]|nr:MAG: leucine--tRNA ligase [Methanosarcinales archaeon]
MNPRYNPRTIESEWQRKWDESRIFQPDISDKEKYFITIPYPYLNGNLHAGHTRTFTIGDVIARYRRMLGLNVLFPMAFHATGTPIIGLAELIAKRDPETLRVYTELHGIPDDVIAKLDSPESLVEYFGMESEAAMRLIGYSIDWTRRFTTIDPAYTKFVEWQFNKLHELGHIVKGSHPVRWCPNDENPVEDHDLLHGEGANILDYTLLKFKLASDVSDVSDVSDGSGRSDEWILPCATLRPETVFGVTNLWVNPDIVHAKVTVNGEQWIVSEEAYRKLTHTDKVVRKIGEIKGEDLIGKTVENPLINHNVLILPANFVDPANGSGIVMSVPAHAPYDYLALRDLKGANLGKYGISDDISDLKMISLISVPDMGEFPAIEAVDELGVSNQSDPLTEQATKLVYRREFHNGVLKENTGKYAGIAVSKIKDVLTSDLVERGVADIFYEFSELPVVCRCGTTCVVKMVKDQWFVNYSNPEWKDQVYAHLADMQIIPEELRVEFENKIDWLKDKACARRKGLGTRLPWDNEWLIESLADSTIYMSYYIISKYLDRIDVSQLTPAFFDYVLLGKGDARNLPINEDLAKQIRADLKYWYPVDIRSSGKDLVPNHLLFFLFHHVAIFPKEMLPRAIAVNGFVSLEGAKMSKSKGPLLTLKHAVTTYGADVTRLYILGTAEHTQDADWRSESVNNNQKQVEKFYNLVYRVISDPEADEPPKIIDKWMMSRLQHRISETREALEVLRTRHALQNAFYLLMHDLKWYQRRGGVSSLKAVAHVWIRLMAPFMPHICEELWKGIGEDGFISLSEYPAPDPNLVDRCAERAEELVENTLDDIEEIIRVTSMKPERITLFTAPAWKNTVLKQALIASRSGKLDMGALMKELMQDPEIKKHARDVPKFVQQLIKDVRTWDAAQVNNRLEGLDERAVLSEALEFFERELGCAVAVLDADAIDATDAARDDLDPQGRRKFAEPGRPAIYVKDTN